MKTKYSVYKKIEKLTKINMWLKVENQNMPVKVYFMCFQTENEYKKYLRKLRKEMSFKVYHYNDNKQMYQRKRTI